MNTEVKIYKGEETCTECGRFVRNVVEIDGVPYGVRCCEKYLPRTHKVIKGEVVQVMSPMEYAASFFENPEVFTRFWVRTSADLRAFLESRTPDHFRYAGVSAILAAKR